MCMVHDGSRVAIGYGTGYHHVKVNAEKRNKSPMPVVIQCLSLYMCARDFDTSSAAISISLLLFH